MAEKPSRKPKKSAGPVWLSFTADEYLQGMRKLVHFSAKTTNSNTPALGVRLSAERQDYPYVSTASLAGEIPLDYLSLSMSRQATQVQAVLSGNTQDYSDIPAIEVGYIQAAAYILDQPFIPQDTMVAKRLRQIILQTADGTDVTLTPLQSAGFSAVLAARLDTEMAEEGSRRRARGFLHFGGSKPQNIGKHVRAMEKPLWFNAPHADSLVREALRLHYNGVDLTIPTTELRSFYIGWSSLHTQQSLERIGHKRHDIPGHLTRLARIWLARGEAAESILRDHQNKLPGGSLLDPGLGLLQQGLVDSSLRSSAWRHKFASTLRNAILTTPVQVGGGDPHLIGVGADDTRGWISIIEDAL